MGIFTKDKAVHINLEAEKECIRRGKHDWSYNREDFRTECVRCGNTPESSKQRKLGI